MAKKSMHVEGIRVSGEDAENLLHELRQATPPPRYYFGIHEKVMLYCIAAGVGVVIAVFGVVFLRLYLPYVPSSAGIVLAALSGLVAGAIWNVLFKRARQHRHRQALRRIGYDICLQCGYWLRGLDQNVDRCPECGAARERSFSRTAPAPEPNTNTTEVIHQPGESADEPLQ